VQDYNRYTMYDGWWGNVGLDVYGNYRSFRFFAEAAMDMTPSFAAIAGTIWSPVYELEMSLLARGYSKGYIATHFGAYSTSSASSNQYGGLFSLRYSPFRQWTILANADYTYYPWKRYGIDDASFLFKARLALQKDFKGGSSILLQGNCNYTVNGPPIFRGRLNVRVALSKRWLLDSRVEYKTRGFAIFQEVTYKAAGGKIECAARVTYYNTEDWDSRVYLYEKGMPQSFSVETYYGKGFGIYGMVRYSPLKNLDLYLKCSQYYSAFLIRIVIPG
jgi:hypothetical protein